MARVCVVGNATHDLNRTSLIAARRPGGTLLYATLALDALGHDVRPIGHAPLRAYLTLRLADVDRTGLELAFPGTRFLNVYDEGRREQWAREGPGHAIDDAGRLTDADGVLLGPVLGEVPTELGSPSGVPTLLDLQGTIRRLGEANLLGYRRVETHADDLALPGSTHVCGSLEELEPIVGTQDPRQAVERLAEKTGRAAVVTLGAEGAIAHADGRTHRARLPRVDVDDPTGAGDVFDAGVLHGLVEDAGLPRCLALGCAAAELFLEAHDAPSVRDRFASLEEVDARADEVTITHGEHGTTREP